MKAVVDTNVIFAYLNKEDSFHEKSKEIIKNLSKIILPTVVIFELVYIFQKHNLNFSIIYDLLTSKEVVYEETKLSDILFALKNKPKSFDEFHDYIILHTAKRLGINLETFDEELKNKFLKKL